MSQSPASFGRQRLGRRQRLDTARRVLGNEALPEGLFHRFLRAGAPGQSNEDRASRKSDRSSSHCPTPTPGVLRKRLQAIAFAGDNFFWCAKEAANYCNQIV